VGAPRRARHSEPASAEIWPLISANPYRTCARIAASAFSGSPDTSASASVLWKPAGSGVRRPVTSNSQFKINTWLRSIISVSRRLPADSAIRMCNCT
jgi:hypothetical protein